MRYQTRFLVMLALSALSIVGCNRGNNNPADGGGNPTSGGQSSSFTLGSITYTTTSVAPVQNNIPFQVDGRTVTLSNFVSDAFGIFSTSENTTICGINGTSNNATIAITLGFSGRATGTFTIPSSGNVAMGVVVGTANYAMTSGQVVVTEYGNSGSRIRGTFSGTFAPSSGGATVQVTNGSFNVTRASDVP